MTSQPNDDQRPEQERPTDPRTWGAPRPARKWTRGRIVGTSAVAVAIVGGSVAAVQIGAGAAAADGQTGPGGRGPARAMGVDGAMTDLMGALHGDFVVPDGQGGYRTHRMQTGQVTAINDTSVTTASTDGYTQSYTIDAETAVSGDRPAVGSTVTVVAEVEGDLARALRLGEPQSSRGQRPQGAGDDPEGPGQGGTTGQDGERGGPGQGAPGREPGQNGPQQGGPLSGA